MIAPNANFRPASLPDAVKWCPTHAEGWLPSVKRGCPKCADAGTPAPASKPSKAPSANGTRCLLGHAHDSKGEATACPIVHARAAHMGLTTFRPGRPGMPCFRVAADDNGRPAYVSVDWVLVDAAGRVAVFVDYKGAVAKSKRLDKGWARGKRIVEAEYGVRVVELATPEEANHVPRESTP